MLISNLKNIGFKTFSGQQRNPSFISCGFQESCTIRAIKLKQDLEGFSCIFLLGRRQIALGCQLIGRHNVLNMLTAAGVGMGLGMNPEDIGRGLAKVRQVPGRLERVLLPPYSQQNSLPRVFVDYAHTPDALKNVL
ncbi:MAG: hypothetical protein ACWGN1_05785, partial [Desulfobulbales bacterium]